MPNFEFIKNRSFEIAWAVFRCAALIRVPRLKKELEDCAVSLVSKYGDSGTDNNSETLKVFSEIQKLNSTVKLAEAIGEIKIVNARVLYRELNNLLEEVKSAIRYFEEESAKKSNRDVSIEDIFENNSGNQKNAINENKGDSARNELPIKQSASSPMAISVMKQSAPKVELAVAFNSAISTIKKSKVQSEDDSIQDSWQNLIYRKIKEFGKTSTKEISAFFPEISERTVRFYLQKLTDSGFIEKIGTTGPGSYYVYRK